MEQQVEEYRERAKKRWEQFHMQTTAAAAAPLEEDIGDEELARLLQREEELSSPAVIAETAELLDPTPDVAALLVDFDRRLFQGKLVAVSVSWSKRMTLCAGTCSYSSRAGFCEIKLSEPLLRYRPRQDTVNTLLHEAIHAYLFVTKNNRDRDDHGPEFQRWAATVNTAVPGAHVTTFHSFHDEVDHFRQHHWQCTGVCKDWPPFFGLVKRATNRPPGPNDPWWDRHEQKCGGTFVKTHEPEGYGVSKRRKRQRTSDDIDDGKPQKKTGDIASFFIRQPPPPKP